MRKNKKRFLKLGALVAGIFVLASCTKSFCSEKDVAHMLYKLDSGLVTTVNETTQETEFVYNETLEEIVKGANAAGYHVPTIDYFVALDAKVLNYALSLYDESADVTTATTEVKDAALKEYGYLKFLGSKDNRTTPTNGTDLWGNWELWNKQIEIEEGYDFVPDRDFSDYYKTQIYSKVSAKRSCIAIYDGEYGPSGEESLVQRKTWKYAFEKGFIEGLLVYPVAALVDVLTKAFGAGGWGQILAIFITTIIVRGLLILATLKQTIGSQKMQVLQPELAKLQQRYPNSDTNRYEKQALAQKQMELYKKHGINPLGSMLIMLLQFPVFIAVWGAMTGSAVLASDAVLGLNLSAQLGASMISNFFSSGWWTAVVLFILMTSTQFISTRLSTWLNKEKTKNIAKTQVNPAATKQQSQAKTMMNVMFIMIIVMSVTLPAAMGVYWLVGAIISIVQTYSIHKVMERKKK